MIFFAALQADGITSAACPAVSLLVLPFLVLHVQLRLPAIVPSTYRSTAIWCLSFTSSGLKPSGFARYVARYSSNARVILLGTSMNRRRTHSSVFSVNSLSCSHTLTHRLRDMLPEYANPLLD